MNECYPQEAQMAKSAGVLGRLDDPGQRTVNENIDIKIAALTKEIERLEASKVTLAPLLGMRIRDIREAMSF